MNESTETPRAAEPAALIAAMGAGLICVLIIVAATLCSPASGQTLLPVPDAAFSRGAPQCPPRGITIDGTVIRVIDGDTIVLRSVVEYQVRLQGCWSPESRTLDLKEKAQGLKSKARMQQLATGKPVRVHMPTTTDLSDALTLGRVLGRVWVLNGDRPESCDLSSIMVAEKLAAPVKPKLATPTKQQKDAAP